MMAELESFSFGDSPELADELLELVLMGKKTATCWAASEGNKGVVVGKRWSRTGKGGRARSWRQSNLTGGGSGRSTPPSLTTRVKATVRSPIGARRTPIISPGGANSRRIWIFIASGSGWSRS
jgi:hypothetical protein